MKFSLCDQYSTIRVSIAVLTIFKIPSYLYNKTIKKTNQILIHYLQSVLILHYSEFRIFNIQSSKTTCCRSLIFDFLI